MAGPTATETLAFRGVTPGGVLRSPPSRFNDAIGVGGGGDLLDRGLREAEASEDLGGRRQDALAGRVGRGRLAHPSPSCCSTASLSR